MDFEFDPAKSAANKARHGVDFVEAQRLWPDEALIEVPAKTEDEPRFLAIGRMAGKHRSAVCVRRGGADADHLGPPSAKRGDRPL